MKRITLTLILCILAAMLVLLSLSGQEKYGREPENLLANIHADAATANMNLLTENASIYSNLSISLLRACHREENTLLSPLSTVYGLAMTANGADGETLAQLENLFGMSIPEMNEYLYSYTVQLDRSGDILTRASSLWLSEGTEFKVSRNFLKTCATWYNADIYQTDFSDDTLEAMNAWTLENTGNSIISPIQSFRQPEGLILMNTLLFDGHWETPFSESSNFMGTFTHEDGTEASAVYMRSTEEIYIEDDFCTGFLKPYWSKDYIFAVLLPREDMTIEALLSALDGHSLSSLFASPHAATVYVTMPKFTDDVSLDMISALQRLGVTDIFDVSDAELTGIGGNHLHITDILQSTCITVDEIGTRAAAVTAEAAFPAFVRELLEEKYVDLNRPFVYMILETENHTPVFLGTVMTPE